MIRFKKLILCLNLKDDAAAIAWASKISNWAKSTEVLCFHSHLVEEIPTSVVERFPWLAEPLNDQIEKKMESLMADHWEGCPETKITFKVVSDKGEPFAILKEAIDDSSDLIILSRDSESDNLPVKLARKSPCSIMAVPENSPTKLERILVPTDFSPYSELALDIACAFANTNSDTEIDSLHVFNLGYSPNRASIPVGELVNLADAHAKERNTAFLANANLDPKRLHPEQLYLSSLSTGILKFRREGGHDLIVTGCRGKDSITSFLLGSNAEELLKHSTVPVIAVKKKGTGLKLLQALFSE